MKALFPYKPIEYVNKILAGVSTGIVVGLIANAILGEVFKGLLGFTGWQVFQTLWEVVFAIQFTVPLIIGALVGLQFGFNGIQLACLAGATFIGSGVVNYNPELLSWTISGTGDLFNVMFTAFFAVVIIDFFKSRLGSLTVVLLPILGAGLAGFLGLMILPSVSSITSTLGNLINAFTNMQKLLMGILISSAFSIFIITPVSTVAIGLAVGLTGISAGSAALGVAACTAVLVIGSIKVRNEKGVTIAVLLGAMKMMIPNLIKHPIMLLPVVTTASITGLVGAFFSIAGTAQTAGFGLVGLVGPIGAYKGVEGIIGTASPLTKIGIIVVSFFVVTFGVAYICDLVYRKTLKLYTNDIFENKGGM